MLEVLIDRHKIGVDSEPNSVSIINFERRKMEWKASGASRVSSRRQSAQHSSKNLR